MAVSSPNEIVEILPTEPKVEITNILRIRKVHDSAILPTRATPDSAGLDLYSPRNYVIRKGGNLLINLELKIEIPVGHFGKIEGKSGLAYYNSIGVGAGVIDKDYTGRIQVLLFNHGDEHFLIDRGDAVAQLLILPVLIPTPILVYHDFDSPRTEGFGATSLQTYR